MKQFMPDLDNPEKVKTTFNYSRTCDEMNDPTVNIIFEVQIALEKG